MYSIPTCLIIGAGSTGKTKLAKVWVANYAALGIVDEWTPKQPIKDGYVHVTNSKPRKAVLEAFKLAGGTVLTIEREGVWPIR